MKLKTLFESLDSEIRELERVLGQDPNDVDVKMRLQHLLDGADRGLSIILSPKGGLSAGRDHDEKEIGSIVLRSGLSVAQAENYVSSINDPKNPRCPECDSFMPPMTTWTPGCEFCSNYKESIARQITRQRELEN